MPLHDDNGVLINKMSIRNSKHLQEYDLLLSKTQAPIAFAFALEQTCLGMDSLNGIHAILFDELYEWAGKARTTNLYKGESSFAPWERIDGWLNSTMPQFNIAARQRPDEFYKILAELWGRVNRLHPYPEGNGRATQIYINAAARKHGWDIDWSLIDRGEELDAAYRSLKEDFAGYRSIANKAMVRPRLDETKTVFFPTRG